MAKTGGGAKSPSSSSSSSDAAKKKKAHQKKAERERKLEAKVLGAYNDVDPSAALAPFLAKPYSRNGLNMTVVPTNVKGLSASDKKWIWSLLEKNMRPVYGEESWTGGEAKDKKNELVDEDARYLIAREVVNNADAAAKGGENANPNDDNTASASTTRGGAPLGFVHYRFVIEEDVAVLYVYELQVDAKAQRKGLGKFLMMLCEALAKKAGMSGVMLTVQKANEGASTFYQGAKYAVSLISPSKVDPWGADEYDYEILDKVWDADAKSDLEKNAQAAWRENKQMFDTAQCFVHSNAELMSNAAITAS